MADSYARRVGSQEAREGRIAVMKAALSVFPPVGQPFRATVEGKKRELRLEAYPCTCRGPEKPHEHWYISWPGIRQGDTVTFSRGGEGWFEVTLRR